MSAPSRSPVPGLGGLLKAATESLKASANGLQRPLKALESNGEANPEPKEIWTADRFRAMLEIVKRGGAEGAAARREIRAAVGIPN